MGDILKMAGRRTAAALIAALVCAGAATRAGAQQNAEQRVNERGPATAPVTIVEFCAYDSEACARVGILLDVMLREFGDRLRLVFHHVPADDTPAASLRYRAALAAGQQDQFWPMHEILMANRQRATRADILAMAQQLGLDAERFRADLDSAETMAAAKSDQNEAVAQNVAKTPALIVNGRSLAAIAEARDLRAAIHLALAAR